MMKAYPEYYETPDSRWFDRLPASWSCTKAKRLFTNIREKSDSQDEQLAASQKYGVIPQRKMIELNNANVMLALKGTDNFKKVRQDDFVISLRSFEGGIEHSAYDGCITPAYTVLKLAEDNLSPSYFRYALKSTSFITALNSTSEGIRDGKNISYDEFSDLQMAVPNFKEQILIAKFLDVNTARIDNLIAEKQSFIKLLQEKRQALISHVVTKGLDDNVKMKPSGVEWIGDIPEHWEVIPLKHCISFQEGPGILAVDFHDKGVPLIRISGIKGETVSLEGCNYLAPTKVKEKWSHFRLKKGDLVISGSATMGQVCKVDEVAEGAILYTGLIRLNPSKEKLLEDFLKIALASNQLLTQIELLKAGATMQHFGPSHLNKMSIVIAPIEEQKRISIYIEENLSKLDRIVEDTEKSIELLKEHRTALISAAVTGKIDVREEV